MNAQTLAFQLITQVATQMITLSTGMLALSISFAGSIGGPVEGRRFTMLRSSWVIHALSIVCGVWVLSALAGSALAGSSPDGTNVKPPAVLQVLTFLGGTALTFIVCIGAKMPAKGRTRFRILSGTHAEVEGELNQLDQNWEIASIKEGSADRIVVILKRSGAPGAG